MLFDKTPLEEKKKRLIEELERLGYIKSPSVKRAMMAVPRELFVLEKYRKNAYDDIPLPILANQTISAPHMVAMMTELLSLKPGHKVLEVGTGSGYQAAICAEIVAPKGSPVRGHVYSIERIRELVEFARNNLKRAGYLDRVTVIHGDGSLGLPSEAPFDRIVVTAAAPQIPPPLVEQLNDRDGVLVIPVGSAYSFQELKVLVKRNGRMEVKGFGFCVFVPLIGKYGVSSF